MKDRIRSAQIVLPCANLNRTLEFFTEKLGFRLEMIFPADSPSTAVVSGYGIAMRLETSKEVLQSTPALRLSCDLSTFPDDTPREIYSPDGVRIILADAKSRIEIPEGAQAFVLTAFEGENSWSEGRAGMQYRDLIPSRLGGRFIASHIRILEGGEVPDYVHYHKIRFQMIYCISGWARLVYEDQGQPFLMKAGDCILQPPEIRHRVLESSAGLEVLEIGCPAIHETFADHKIELPNDNFSPERIFGGQRFAHHIADEAVWRKSLIEGFESRDTGISKATDGLAEVRVLRAISDSRFSIKHSGEFLFFFILKGNLRLSNKEGKIYHMGAKDSFVLPAGDEFFLDAGGRLEMIRVSLPAEQLKSWK
jgi:mannose-6-phosphate isomerase-like protein (cupin superfamily)